MSSIYSQTGRRISGRIYASLSSACCCCCSFHCSRAYSCISVTVSFSSTISVPSIVSMTSSIVTMLRKQPYSSMMTEICSSCANNYSQILETLSLSGNERMGRTSSSSFMLNLSSDSFSRMVWRST